jgi:hypothetical protein
MSLFSFYLQAIDVGETQSLFPATVALLRHKNQHVTKRYIGHQTWNTLNKEKNTD